MIYKENVVVFHTQSTNMNKRQIIVIEDLPIIFKDSRQEVISYIKEFLGYYKRFFPMMDFVLDI